MEQERQSIAVEIPVVEGCFSEEAQRLLQPKSGSRLEGWGESLLEERYRNYLIAALLIIFGLAVVALSVLIKFVVFKTSDQRNIANCIEDYTSFDGWQFRQLCKQCQTGFLSYDGQCIRFQS